MDLEGVLQQTDQLEDAETIVLDPDALRLAVGEARLTLHPDHFIDAVHTPYPHGGWLKLVMGQVEISPRPPATCWRLEESDQHVQEDGQPHGQDLWSARYWLEASKSAPSKTDAGLPSRPLRRRDIPAPSGARPGELNALEAGPVRDGTTAVPPMANPPGPRRGQAQVTYRWGVRAGQLPRPARSHILLRSADWPSIRRIPVRFNRETA